ncbi:SDR family NAD(P)-dependent oxidoreductase [Novosphingobium sp. BL-52-GroH]|uniref:SDR family NAD(P)-dependent oxidoreductase n=1 Tax=Novosphingobium sp. BL-52-GroH TaxID=3349877 RepID=UPI0038509580
MTKPLAIITGGNTGIGRHLVTRFVGEGYAVAFSYRGAPEAAASLTAELGEAVLGIECDVGVKAQVDAFFAAATKWHPAAPHVLVNNAGIQTHAKLVDLSEESWDNVIRTNLKGCFLNTQAAARWMIEGGRGGSIINIGSGCNKLGFPRLVDYTASKGGIEQFTKVAAVELGPNGITVNCVAPGAIATERTLRDDPDHTAIWSPITPLRRPGNPEDVVGVVLFFASPAASFVTGQTLWVDGGAFTRPNWPHIEQDD